jgi:hypothetical protein
MDFHALTRAGEVHILSTDDDGRILTPLPDSPPPGAAQDHLPNAAQPPSSRANIAGDMSASIAVPA